MQEDLKDSKPTSTQRSKASKSQSLTSKSRSLRSRRANDDDSSFELGEPINIPQNQGSQMIVHQCLELSTWHLIIQVPFYLLAANKVDTSIQTSLGQVTLMFCLTKQDETIRLFSEAKSIEDPETRVFEIWGKALWIGGTQVKSKLIKKARKEFQSMELIELSTVHATSLSSDFFFSIFAHQQECQSDLYSGLVNQGNTCYMNSYLQTIYHLPHFRQLVFRVESGEAAKFPATLQSLFYALDQGKKAASPEDLIRSFGWGKKEAQVQQDAQEFSCLFFDVLGRVFGSMELHTQLEGPSLNDLFEGELTHVLRCTDIGISLLIQVLGQITFDYRSVNQERFLDLQLSVSGSLEDALDDYVAEHHLAGDNLYMHYEHGLQNAVKSVYISRLPPILMIQIKRFLYNPASESNEKILSEFKYPERLDFSRWIQASQPQTQCPYFLYGVLVHEGRKAESGHYYAFLRCEEGWFKFNDQSVTEVTENTVLKVGTGGDIEGLILDQKKLQVFKELTSSKTTAYMLVYVRQGLEDIYSLLRPSYPDWLIKREEGKVVEDEEKKRRKLFMNEIRFLSWNNLQGKECPSVGFIWPASIHTAPILPPVRKSQTMAGWMHEIGSQNIYLASANSKYEVLSPLSGSDSKTTYDTLKHYRDPFLLLLPFSRQKNEVIVLLKRCISIENAVPILQYRNIMKIERSTTCRQLLESLEKEIPQVGNQRSVFYWQDRNLLTALSRTDDIIPQPRQPSNCLLIIVEEPVVTNQQPGLVAEAIKALQMTVCVKVEFQRLEVPRLQLQIESNCKSQHICKMIHEALPEFVTSSEHLIVKFKPKKTSKVWVQATKAQTVREMIKYDNVVYCAHSLLNEAERETQTCLSFKYRFVNGVVSKDFNVIVSKASEEHEVVQVICEHPQVHQCLKMEGFNFRRLLLMNSALTTIESPIEASGYLPNKGDLRTVLAKERSRVLVVQGEFEAFQSDHDVYALLHHVTRSQEATGTPKCLKLKHSVTLTELKELVVRETQSSQFLFDGREYPVVLNKIRITASARRKTKMIVIKNVNQEQKSAELTPIPSPITKPDEEESESVHEVKASRKDSVGRMPVERTQVDGTETNPNDSPTIRSTFGPIKSICVCVEHLYLSSGLQPLRLNIL